MIEAKELRDKTTKELETLLGEKRQSLWNFKFGVTGSKVRNVKEGQTIRKEIAKILTIIKEKSQ